MMMGTRQADIEDELGFQLKAHSFGVKSVTRSTQENHSLNIVLLEDVTLKVSLTLRGYSLVSYAPESLPPPLVAAFEGLHLRHFETLEALLHTASPRYREAFQRSLFDKLTRVKEAQEEEEQEEEEEEEADPEEEEGQR